MNECDEYNKSVMKEINVCSILHAVFELGVSVFLKLLLTSRLENKINVLAMHVESDPDFSVLQR